MLRVHALIGANNLYLSGEPLDYDDKFWQPRIINEFEINREFEFSSNNNNKITSLSLSLDNSDGYFDTYETTLGLLNQKFTFYFNEGDDKVKSFTGKVNKVSSYGEKISLEVLQTGYEYLDMPMPDAQIAYDFYSTNGLNHSWNAVPVPIGTVNRMPLAWVNLAYSEFIIGSGPIFKVRKLYFDKVEVYNVDSGVNGYQPSPDYAKVKFRIFHGAGTSGAPETVDGHVSRYPGFAYIEVYKDVGGDPADPLTPDGDTAQIYADVDGLRNAGNTDAERNPAQILYNLYTKNSTEWEGYGLGVTPDDDIIDFNDAIDECTAQGFKIDGVLDKTTEFREWQKEICKCCRGAVVEEEGKIKMYIDTVKIPATTLFDESGDSGYVCDVSTWSEPDLESQINRMKLSYSWNFELQNYNKKPAINGESSITDPYLVNETHALRIGKWNTEELNFKLIKDDATAHKLAQYYLNKQVLQLKTATLTTIEDIPNLDAKDNISVTCSRYGWVAKEFIITKISRAQGKTTMSIREYASGVYTFVNPGTGVEETGNTYSVYNIPEKPVMTSLNLVNETLADGTNQTKVNVNFTRPATNVVMTALYYKLSSEAESEFRALDVTVDTSQIQTIWKGIESGSYNFRLVSISPVGIYSGISIESGDTHYYGQPGSETTLVVVGDAGIPGQPNISRPVPTKGGASIYIEIAGGLPDDFSHFKIFRQFSGYPKAEISNNQSGQLFVDNDNLNQYLARQYSAIAYDKTGNASPESNLSLSITPLQIGNNDITEGEQIIAKDFRTALNVEIGTPGVAFNSFGLNAYNNTANTFSIDANTGNVTMTGTITATDGLIGGFTIDETEGLYAGTGATRVQMKAGVGFWAGATAQVDAPFSVSQAGALKATSGLIGGFTIDETEGLYAGCNSTRVQMKAGAGFWAGATAQVDAPFSVNQAGCLKAESGLIAGWTVTGSYLYKYNSSNYMYLHSDYNTIYTRHNDSGIGVSHGQICSGTIMSGRYGLAVFQGTERLFEASSSCCMFAGWNFDTNKLYNDKVFIDSAGGLCGNYTAGTTGWCIGCDGSAEFSTVTVRGTVCADCGCVGGWLVNATQIYSASCGLILCSTGSISSGSFTSGNKGWQIDCNGDAEFNNITARGAIRTAVFIKDEISVIGGRTLIRPATILTTDETFASGSSVFSVDDNAQFAINDIIRIKDGINDYWGTVTASTTGLITASYNFGTTVGSIFTTGQAIVNYGCNVCCGGITLDGQCPYIDIYTHSGTPWLGTDSKVRLGNLKGWGGFSPTVDTYGIGIGTSAGHCLSYDDISGTLNIKGAINIQAGSSIAGTAIGTMATRDSVLASDMLGTGGTGGAINDDPNFTDSSAWMNHGGGGQYVFTTVTDGKVGNNLLRSATGVVSFPFTARYYPIDLNKTYRIRAWVRKSATSNGRLYMSWQKYDANGTKLDGNEGCYVVGGVTPSTSWTEYSVVVGYGTSTLAQSNAKTMKIGFLLNHGASSGYMEVQDFRIEEVLPGSLVRGMDNLSNLTTSVIPTTAIAPSGAGLYLGSNFLGYYDSSNWKTYMDNSGNFHLGGSSPTTGLSWDATSDTLTVNGIINIQSGSSGYSQFSDKPTNLAGINSTEGTKLTGIATGADVTSSNTSYDTARVSGSLSATVEGGALLANAGFDASSRLVTAVIPTVNVAPSGDGLYLGADYMGFHCGTDWKTYMDNNGDFFLGGSSTSNGLAWDASADSLIIHGAVYADTGVIGGFTIDPTEGLYAGTGATRVQMKTGAGFWAGATAQASAPFSVNQVGYLKSTYGLIGGWNFNAACLYSANNCIVIDSTGSIKGHYSATVGAETGWCINSAGNAVFNNATVRGTVCADAGYFGNYCIVNGKLHSESAGYSTSTMSTAFNSTSSSRCYCNISQPQGIFLYFNCTSPSSCINTVNLNYANLTYCTVAGDNHSTLNSAELRFYSCVSGSTDFKGSQITHNGIDIYHRTSLSCYRCSRIQIYGSCTGSSSMYAPLKVCVIGGNTCYAICANGIIQSGMLCSTGNICATYQVKSNCLLGVNCVETPIIRMANGTYIGSMNTAWLHFYGVGSGNYFYCNISGGFTRIYQNGNRFELSSVGSCSYLQLQACTSGATYQARLSARYCALCPMILSGYANTPVLHQKNAYCDVWITATKIICADAPNFYTPIVNSGSICATCCVSSPFFISSHNSNQCLDMNASRMACNVFCYSTAAIAICVPITNHYAAIYTNGKIIGIYQTFSDRNMKCDFNFNYSILGRLRKAPMGAWKWRSGDGTDCHVGMIAQDFDYYFPDLSDSCTMVPNMDGIALMGVKEVDENVQALEQCNIKLENCINTLDTVIKIQGNQISEIQKQIGGLL